MFQHPSSTSILLYKVVLLHFSPLSNKYSFLIFGCCAAQHLAIICAETPKLLFQKLSCETMFPAHILSWSDSTLRISYIWQSSTLKCVRDSVLFIHVWAVFVCLLCVCVCVCVCYPLTADANLFHSITNRLQGFTALHQGQMLIRF